MNNQNEETNSNDSPADSASSGDLGERPYSVNRACEGCLASFSFMILVVLILISGILRWLKIDAWLNNLSTEQQRGLLVGLWLIATVIGGYVAARRGKTTGWTNALVVGILAILFQLGQIVNQDGVLDVINQIRADPLGHWAKFVMLFFTIPAALLGGWFWSRKHPTERH